MNACTKASRWRPGQNGGGAHSQEQPRNVQRHRELIFGLDIYGWFSLRPAENPEQYRNVDLFQMLWEATTDYLRAVHQTPIRHRPFLDCLIVYGA
jgi:hypothetical protein